MARTMREIMRATARSAALLAVIGLAAPPLARPAFAEPAPQGEKPASGSPLKWIMKKIDFATDSDEKKPDFIEKSRPPQQDMKYIGVGEKRPERALKAKSKVEAKNAEAELAIRAKNMENLAANKPKALPPPTLPPAVLEAQQKAAAERAARAKAGLPGGQ